MSIRCAIGWHSYWDVPVWFDEGPFRVCKRCGHNKSFWPLGGIPKPKPRPLSAGGYQPFPDLHDGPGNPPRLNAQSAYVFEHKGYKGSMHCSPIDDNEFFGKVLNTDALIMYSGATPEELKQQFIGAVDDYIEHCRNHGVEPHQSWPRSAPGGE